jgi:hypothetical protein
MTSPPVMTNFPVPVLTPFATNTRLPSHVSLLVLQRELNSNAMSVHSYAGGGRHGHLALTVTPLRYSVLVPTNTPFIAPTAPTVDPTITNNATGPQISEAIRNHQEQIRVFQRYHDTDRALLRALLEATPSTYIEALADPDVGFANVTTLDVLTHLLTTYGALTAADRDANLIRMQAAWSPPQPIEALFKQLDDGNRLATSANEPIASTQLARMGLHLLVKTGLFPDGCREWRMKPDADQTWPQFKIHFARQDRDRQEIAATTTGTFSGTVNAVAPAPPAAPVNPIPGHGSANAIVSPLPTAAEYATLLAELARLRATNPAPSARQPPRGYCWTHGSTSNATHTSATCKTPADGHVHTATWRNKCGGNPNTFIPATRRPRAPGP